MRNLGLAFDDPFKADNHILFIVSKANIMIISREPNVVLKIYKTVMRP